LLIYLLNKQPFEKFIIYKIKRLKIKKICDMLVFHKEIKKMDGQCQDKYIHYKKAKKNKLVEIVCGVQ
jgi:hypothetical protein